MVLQIFIGAYPYAYGNYRTGYRWVYPFVIYKNFFVVFGFCFGFILTRPFLEQGGNKNDF